MQLRCHQLVKAKLRSIVWQKISSLSSAVPHNVDSNRTKPDDNVRFNSCGIQMINEELRSYLFGCKQEKKPADIDKARNHLNKFDLLNKNPEKVKDVANLRLPKLYGANLDEHFTYIGYKQILKYTKLLNSFCASGVPDIPDEFEFQAGWTK